MKAIWKYAIDLAREVTVHMPAGARILSVQSQLDQAQVWALVDPAADLVQRRFGIYGTGWDLHDAPGEYVGTFQDGWFVWHVFDRGEI